MKRIMKVAVLTACVGAMLSFAGCNKGDADKGAVADTKVAAQGKSAKDVATKEAKSEDAPEKVVLSVLTAMAKGKVDDAFIKSHCTERAAKSLIKFKADLEMVLNGATFEIVSVKVDGETAIAMVKQNGGFEGAGTTEEYPVKKVGGHWEYDRIIGGSEM